MISLSSYAQNSTHIDEYIERFQYRSLEVPAKRRPLFELGARLFKDQGLSGKNNISCESCHSHEGFSGDGLPLGIGEGGQGIGARRLQKDGLVLARHSQNIYNLGLPGFRRFFWDGRVQVVRFGHLRTPEPKFNGEAPELADVVKTFESPLAVMSVFPLTSPEEMLGKESTLTRLEAWDFVLKKIFSGPAAAEYWRLFRGAYPGVATYNIAHVGNAFAEFMRHDFAAVNTPWDHYLRGRKAALTPRMKRGAVVFHEKANCTFCHNGNHFTNQGFENIGVPGLGADDRGLANYRFKVPALRNAGVTAPYMHSGVFRTLREVVNHYNDPVANLRNFRWPPGTRTITAPLPRTRIRLTMRTRNGRSRRS
jgi:cytochrome c peroxidase